MNTSNAAAISLPLTSGYTNLKVVPAPKKMSWKKLAVTLNDEVRFVPFDDILYCMSINNYTTIYLRGGTSYLYTKTLKEVESRLPEDSFLRIHKSYLVNTDCITALKRNSLELVIDGKVSLPISRTKKNELYGLFNL